MSDEVPEVKPRPSKTGQRSHKGPALLSRLLGRRDATEVSEDNG